MLGHMEEKRTLLTVTRHADALPILAKLETAGINTEVVGQSTTFSKIAKHLIEGWATRDLPGKLGQQWRIVVSDSDFARAHEVLTAAGLMRVDEADGPPSASSSSGAHG